VTPSSSDEGGAKNLNEAQSEGQNTEEQERPFKDRSGFPVDCSTPEKYHRPAPADDSARAI
jgi:hypothetical protein